MKNFFEYKDEKITERAFSQGLAVSVIGILICIVALCSATYAWFSGGVASNNNMLVSGSFDIAVSVTKTHLEDGTATTGDNTVTADASGKYKLMPGTYAVTLKPADAATVKGYCIVTVDSKAYITSVILDEDMVDEVYTASTSPLEFTVTVSGTGAEIAFDARWGIPAAADIESGDTVTAGS